MSKTIEQELLAAVDDLLIQATKERSHFYTAKVLNIKPHFEANMLDGDDVNDCGKAMLSAKSVLEYIQEYYDLKEVESSRPSSPLDFMSILVKHIRIDKNYAGEDQVVGLFTANEEIKKMVEATTERPSSPNNTEMNHIVKRVLRQNFDPIHIEKTASNEYRLRNGLRSDWAKQIVEGLGGETTNGGKVAGYATGQALINSAMEGKEAASGGLMPLNPNEVWQTLGYLDGKKHWDNQAKANYIANKFGRTDGERVPTYENILEIIKKHNLSDTFGMSFKTVKNVAREIHSLLTKGEAGT